MTPAVGGGWGGLLRMENEIMYAAVHWTQKQIHNLINKQRPFKQEACAVVGL